MTKKSGTKMTDPTAAHEDDDVDIKVDVTPDAGEPLVSFSHEKTKELRNFAKDALDYYNNNSIEMSVKDRLSNISLAAEKFKGLLVLATDDISVDGYPKYMVVTDITCEPQYTTTGSHNAVVLVLASVVLVLASVDGEGKMSEHPIFTHTARPDCCVVITRGKIYKKPDEFGEMQSYFSARHV